MSISNLRIFLFFILISIGYLTTNNDSRVFIESIRSVAIVSCGVFVCLNFFRYRNNKILIHSSIVFFFFLLGGLGLAMMTGSWEMGTVNLVRDSLVVLVGILIFSSHQMNDDFLPVAKIYVIYVLLGLFLTLIVGGVSLDFPPRFNFDYSSELSGSNIIYSQGVSSFFGFGGVAAAYVAGRSKGILERGFWISIFALLIFLSMAGGARGDALAAIVVANFYLLYVYRKYWYVWALAIGFLVSILMYYWNDLLGRFVFLERLSYAETGDFGMRDVLVLDAIKLLINQTECVIFGCGFGYFQYYYDYDFGLYPHNLIMELIIAFGLPIAVVAIFSVSMGLRIYLKNNNGSNLLILFYLMAVLISLKSGYLFGEWLTICLSIYFAGIYLHRTMLRFDRM